MVLNPNVSFALADEPDSVERYAKAGVTALGIRSHRCRRDVIETLRAVDVLAYTGSTRR